jgi:hypothetical protein
LTNGRQPTQSTEAEHPPRNTATATVGQGVSILRAGAPAQPAPGDLLLPTWHTLGRLRDDFTPQSRAPLQFTQRVRRLGCDQESSSGPPARRSRNQDPPQSTGPAPRRRNPNLNGPAQTLRKFYNRPDFGPPQPCPDKTLFTPTSALGLGIKIHSTFAGYIQTDEGW